jgi:hypothetical protein
VEPQAAPPGPHILPLRWICAVAAVFLVVGPLVGTAPVLLDSIFGDALSSVNMRVVIGFGYLLGGAPALVTGLISGWLVGRVRWSAWRWAAALTGAVVSSVFALAFCLVMAITRGESEVPGLLILVLLFAALGAAAGFVSTLAAWVLLISTRFSPDWAAPSPPS